MVSKADTCLDKVSSAGCVFIGEKASVVMGDYVAGPSHALPTAGTARFSSPLNVGDFIKFISLVNIDETSLKKLGRAASTIARAEGFDAHALAIERRLKSG
jgi:histidinol dehydrogenase